MQNVKSTREDPNPRAIDNHPPRNRERALKLSIFSSTQGIILKNWEWHDYPPAPPIESQSERVGEESSLTLGGLAGTSFARIYFRNFQVRMAKKITAPVLWTRDLQAQKPQFCNSDHLLDIVSVSDFVHDVLMGDSLGNLFEKLRSWIHWEATTLLLPSGND